MARIVELKDSSPLLVKAEHLTNGVCAVCRCGLSGKWPFCDGTHKATIGEDPAKLYHYDRELPQGTPRRHEIDLGELEEQARSEGRRKEEDPPVAGQEGHGAGATPVRPPRPSPQHANPQGREDEGTAEPQEPPARSG
ncbi:MAG TPA: CDGSH iron-sulfur domain-containing protein [Candidatus Thermoplasmatota archaeon]|nr:CDGSH iron-sulfur domain-containing protein [Candidatus Thermoplasmatota archaeon]